MLPVPGTQVNLQSCLKRLVRPNMTSVGNQSYKVQILNSDRPVSNIRDAFHGITHVVVVVGKTGTGKTSLLDTLTNSFYGVKFQDEFRYTMKSDAELQGPQVDSQTKQITVYVMKTAEKSLAIIDTPGFADTDGTTDTGIPEMLKRLVDDAGHPDINGICFVVKGTENRIGAAEKKLFTDVLKLFPKTAKRSTFACFTFCNDPDPPVNASNAFSKGIYGNTTTKNHQELTFDNSKVMYGTDISEQTTDRALRRSEDNYDLNMESCEQLFAALVSSSFSSRGVSDVIGSRKEAEVKFYHIKICIARLCEVITDLFREKKRREEVRQRVIKERAELKRLQRQRHLQRQQWEREQQEMFEQQRVQWENNQRQMKMERERFEQELRRLEQEMIEQEREIQDRIQRDEEELAKITNVHCGSCKTVCCNNCLFPEVEKCDKMVVPETTVGSLIDGMGDAVESVPLVGKVIGSGLKGIARGVGFVSKVWKERECTQCGHCPGDHIFKHPVPNKRRQSTSSSPRITRRLDDVRRKQVDTTFTPDFRMPLRQACPIQEIDDSQLPDADGCPSPEETANKIERELKDAESELVRLAKKLNKVLNYLTEHAWIGPEMTLQSCEAEISDVVKSKCSQNPEAYGKCRRLLMEAFSKALH